MDLDCFLIVAIIETKAAYNVLVCSLVTTYYFTLSII